MISEMEYIDDFLHIPPGHIQRWGECKGLLCDFKSCQVAHIVVSQRNFRDSWRALQQGKKPLQYYFKNLRWRLRPE